MKPQKTTAAERLAAAAPDSFYDRMNALKAAREARARIAESRNSAIIRLRTVNADPRRSAVDERKARAELDAQTAALAGAELAVGKARLVLDDERERIAPVFQAAALAEIARLPPAIRAALDALGALDAALAEIEIAARGFGLLPPASHWPPEARRRAIEGLRRLDALASVAG